MDKYTEYKRLTNRHQQGKITYDAFKSGLRTAGITGVEAFAFRERLADELEAAEFEVEFTPDHEDLTDLDITFTRDNE